MNGNSKSRYRVVFFFLFLFAMSSNYAQQAPNTYLIRFTDKTNSTFSVSAPLSFLSQRAINRRSAQNITISSEDFPVNSTYINQVVATGAQLLNRSRWMNAISVYCTDTNIINTITNLPFVSGVNPVQMPLENSGPKFENERFFEPVNQFRSSQSAQSVNALNYGGSLNQVAMLGGDLLHTAGYTGTGKVIAVIDAGFAMADQCESFDSLFANNQILGTWDFVSGNASVYDDHYHGTYVLSIIAGNVPGSLIGTAPKASFWLLRSENAATEYVVEEFNWVCAAEFADSVGADIINSSLGYTTFDNPDQNHTFSDLDGNTAIGSIGAQIAAHKGMVVCNSAGNSGNNSWVHLGVPADADFILTVGAVDSNEQVADFSSRGNSADGRIKPDVAAQGVATVGQSSPGNIVTGNGTSFSSPLIAGMCASFWQAVPSLTAAQLIQKVKESCDQYTTPDSLKGYGIPDFAQAYYLITGKKLELPITDQIEFVAPNPFHDFIKIRFYSTDTQNIELRVFDILGHMVLQKDVWCAGKTYMNHDLNIPSELRQGIYFLEISSKQSRTVTKLIKE